MSERLVEIGCARFGVGRFDLVVSLGVVEHFTNPVPLFEAHATLADQAVSCSWLCRTTRDSNGWLQRRLDRDGLDRHNLSTMESAMLQRLAEQVGLRHCFTAYVGGFQPTLFERSRSWSQVQ